MGAVAAIGGALIQKSAAKKAAAAQERAAQADIAFQTETRDLIRNDLSTYREGGVAAQNAIDFELGLGARPEGYQGFTATPGYEFRLGEGQRAMEASAAARGGLYSGAAMRDLTKFNQDYGSNEYGNYFSRLGARADTGLNAANMTAASSQQTAGRVGNAFADIGNAQSAGYVGGASALNNGMQNLAGLWNYQKNMNASMPAGQPVAGNNFFGNLFGAR